MSVGAQSLVFWTPPTTPALIYSLRFFTLGLPAKNNGRA